MEFARRKRVIGMDDNANAILIVAFPLTIITFLGDCAPITIIEKNTLSVQPNDNCSSISSVVKATSIEY